uniref:Uncharacterized protein n=1 Tax=Escherichia coli TaxID=562 RepID=C7BUJ8_ECOLX|nr:hypothetical protein [Escherichia coli]
MSIRAWRAARPPFCITFSVWLPAADFIMQVMPDIRFPVTDSDYLFLYLPQPFGHALRSLLPAVTFFFCHERCNSGSSATWVEENG